MTEKIKYRYNQKVIIKEGLYRGYLGIVQDVTTIEEPNGEETKKINKYKLKVEGVPQSKQEQYLNENEIFSYKKYILF